MHAGLRKAPPRWSNIKKNNWQIGTNYADYVKRAWPASRLKKPKMRHVPSPPTALIDSDVYLVVDDFGALGTAYLETDTKKTDEKTVIATC